jgi:hypothetical protein
MPFQSKIQEVQPSESKNYLGMFGMQAAQLRYYEKQEE